jgi:ABC-type multidrug transport system fused ATPase/permease subunit
MNFIKSWARRTVLIGLKRKTMFLLTLTSLVSTISEAFGISMFYPVFQYMSEEKSIDLLINDSKIWYYLDKAYDFLGVELSIGTLLTAVLLFFLMRQLFLYIRIVYRAKAMNYLVYKLRLALFSEYVYTDSDYSDKLETGDFANIVTREAGTAIGGIVAPLDLLTYFIMSLSLLSILLIVSWQITIVTIILMALVSLIPRVWIKNSKKVGRTLTLTNNRLSSFLVERLKFIRLIKLSNSEKIEKQEFGKILDKQRRYTDQSQILSGKTNVVLEPVVISLAILFIYISYQVLHMKIEMIAIYVVVIIRILPVIKSIILQWQGINLNIGAVEIVLGRLMEMKHSKELDQGNKIISSNYIDIELKNVNYSYPESKNKAINNLSFKINNGDYVAIVGPSGSGKSTLIDLIPRIRTIDSGSILINNDLIESYNLSSLRRFISYAPQDPQLFGGTISDHIRYGREDLSDVDVEKSAKLSGASNFIERLPNKYQTLIGESGYNFSGGQVKRLDLARAIANNTKVLILDEPTAHLDSESENLFMNSLKRIHNELNTTIIIITHRLTSIVNVDKIILIEDGGLVLQGSHDYMMKHNKWYSTYYTQQSYL